MNDKNAAPPLTPSRYLGYGLGDFAFNFYWLPLSAFLLKYYTDVLGLSGKVAGAIIMTGLVWDGIVDPAIGAIANRTRSRFGRYRPYMLFGCVPLAASFTLLFFPVSFKDTSLIAYAFATQLLFRSAYAAVNIPYGAMMASMTRDSMERNSLAGVRMFCAFLGSSIVGYFTPRLVAYFQTGHGEYAYFISTALLSTIAIAVTLVSVAMTEERVHDAEERHPPIGEMLKTLAQNTPFLQAAGSKALFDFAHVVVQATLAYYVQYVMGQNSDVTGNVVGMIPTVQMFAIPVWTLVGRYWGKRLAWIFGISLSALALIALFLTDQPGMTMTYLVFAVYAAGAAASAVIYFSIVPDTVEYGEWKTGVRAEGFTFGFVTLVQKVALGVSNAFVGAYLSWIGYVANQQQSPETLAGMKSLITAVATGGLVLSCVVMYFYKLNAAKHAQIVAEIAARQPKTPNLAQ